MITLIKIANESSVLSGGLNEWFRIVTRTFIRTKESIR